MSVRRHHRCRYHRRCHHSYQMTWIMTQCISLMVVLLFIAPVATFNVDTRSVRLIDGPQDSYFGYTVKFHRNSRGVRVLVGAPRAEPEGSVITRPGALYECDVEPNGNCSIVPVDVPHNVEGGAGRFRFNESRDNQWLGVSLDINLKANGSIVVCGHMWGNRIHPRYHLVNGVCYELDAELATSNKLLPLVNQYMQIFDRHQYNYAFGQVGLAAHYVQGSQTLLLGAPGVYGWTGAVFNSGLLDREHWDEIHPQSDTVPSNSYVGYSLSSGRFKHSHQVYYVVGAPRYNIIGKVFIFSGAFNVWYEVEGSQVGGYFGASLCVLDVNADGLDDLLVGEPLYLSDRYEEGRVEVFLNRGYWMFEQQSIYSGAGDAGARFGSAIEAAGDINADTYMDVVISAPYEDDGRGAVYIHHGGPGGISTTSSQHIQARDLDPHIRAFGISISAGMDADHNGYPDVAVGCYESDQVAVLYSRPVIYLEAEMAFHKPHIDLGRYTCNYLDQPATCLQVGFIFRFNSHPSITTIDVMYELHLDTLKDADSASRRGWLKTEGEHLVSHLSGSVTLTRNVEHQDEYLAIFSQGERDLITPIQVELSYQILTPETENVTDIRRVPILDVNHNTTLSRQVVYLRDCGDDNVCDADLHITAWGETVSGSPYIVLGQEDVVHVRVLLTNRGERAYMTGIDLLYPQQVRFVHIHADEPCITCLPAKSATWGLPVNLSLLLCEVDHALPQDDVVSFTVALDVSQMHPSEHRLVLQFTAHTQSEEAEHLLDDNIQYVAMPLVVSAQLDVQGGSTPEQLTFKAAQINKSTADTDRIIHTYEITNYGPGLLPHLPILVRTPSPVHQNVSLISTTSIKVARSGRSFSSDFHCQKKLGTSNDANWATGIFADDGDRYNKGPVILDCASHRCEEYICTLYEVPPGSSFRITAAMSFHLIPTIQAAGEDSIYIASEINITMPGMTVTSPVEYISHKVNTAVFASDPRKVAARVPGWVIAAAAGGGFLILLIIIIILKRVGFFRRKNLEELHRLIQETAENEANEQAAAPSTVASGYDPFASGESSEYQHNGNLHLLNGHPCAYTNFNMRSPPGSPNAGDVTDIIQLPIRNQKQKQQPTEDFGTFLADICAHLRSGKNRNGANEAFCLTPEYLDVHDPNDLESTSGRGHKARPESYLCPVTSGTNIYLAEPETANQAVGRRSSSEEHLSDIGAYYLPSTEQLCNAGFESSLPRRPSPQDENFNFGDFPLQVRNACNNNNELTPNDHRLYPSLSLRVPLDSSSPIYNGVSGDTADSGLNDNAKYSDIYLQPVPQAQ